MRRQTVLSWRTGNSTGGAVTAVVIVATAILVLAVKGRESGEPKGTKDLGSAADEKLTSSCGKEDRERSWEKEAVQYKGVPVSQIVQLSIDEAAEFLSEPLSRNGRGKAAGVIPWTFPWTAGFFLYPDSTFTFLANLYEGQGPVYGTYQTPQKSIFPIPKDKTRAPVQCFVPEPSYLKLE